MATQKQLDRAQAMINDLHTSHEALKQAVRVYLQAQTTAALFDLEHALHRPQTVVKASVNLDVKAAQGITETVREAFDKMRELQFGATLRHHISNLDSIYGSPAIRVGYQPLPSTERGTPPGAE